MHSFIFIIFVIYFQLYKSVNSQHCGQSCDVFKDGKCFKIFKNDLNFNDAKTLCTNNGGSNLLSISSKDEQEFWFSILNAYKIHNGVWINGQFINKTITILNTANDVADMSHDCLQMSMIEPNSGKCINVTCNTKSSVVCEKTNNRFMDICDSENQFKRSFDEIENFKTNFEIYMNSQLENIKKELNQRISSFETELTDDLEARKDLSNQLFKSTKYEMNKNIETLKHEIENTRSDLNNNKLVLRQEFTKLTPPGTISYFAYETSPDGWLKANGQSVSRTIYADLFAKIGTIFGSGDGSNTFTLPDLRSEFIRGWSDGRDVDKDREFGSFQWGSSIPMAGHIDKEWNKIHSSSSQDRWAFAGKTFDDGFEANVPSGQTRNDITYPNDKWGNGVLKGDVVNNKVGDITHWNILKGTRPRNIALLACIKY